MDAVNIQLSRDISKYKSPGLLMPEWKDLTEFNVTDFINSLHINDFNLIGYKSYPRIHAEMIAMKK
jgi:thymidylate synthase